MKRAMPAQALTARVSSVARAWREPLALFFATRLPVLAVMYLGMLLIPVDPKPGMWRAKPDNLFLDGWFRWDTGWYIHLAADGYTNLPNAEGQTDVAFWPLFPLLMRLVAWTFDTKDWALVAFWMNHVLLAGCAFFLFHLARKRHGLAVARLTLVLFLTYPYSTYYSAGYTEATFLFFTLGTFYFANDERWALAAIFCGIGSASRGVAIVSALALAIVYLEKRGWKPSRIRWDVLWLALSVTGFLAYTWFLYRSFGEPFAYVKSFTSRGWGAEVSMQRFWDTLRSLIEWEAWPKGHIRTQDLMCVLAFAFVSVLTVIGARQVPVGETVFAVGSLFVYAKMWPTSGRYVGSIFPIYLTLAQIVRVRPALQTFVTTSFVVLLSLFTVAFGHWVWLSG